MMRQPDPMFIQYMSRRVILSFNPLIPNPLTTRDWTVYKDIEIFHFVVVVLCLLSQKRGWPGTTRLMAEVTPSLGM